MACSGSEVREAAKYPTRYRTDHHNKEPSNSKKKSTVPWLRNPKIDEITGMLFVPEHSTHVGDIRGLLLAFPKFLGRCSALGVPENKEQPAECWGEWKK